jgi:hypothetical protein
MRLGDSQIYRCFTILTCAVWLLNNVATWHTKHGFSSLPAGEPSNRFRHPNPILLVHTEHRNSQGLIREQHVLYQLSLALLGNLERHGITLTMLVIMGTTRPKRHSLLLFDYCSTIVLYNWYSRIGTVQYDNNPIRHGSWFTTTVALYNGTGETNTVLFISHTQYIILSRRAIFSTST